MARTLGEQTGAHALSHDPATFTAATAELRRTRATAHGVFLLNRRSDSAIAIAVFLALLVGFSTVGYWLIFRLESATPLMLSVGLAAIATCLIRRRDLDSLGWRWGAWRHQWLSYALPLGMITAAYLVIWNCGFGQWYDANFVLQKKQDYHLDSWSNGAVIAFHFTITASLSFLLLLPSVLGEELGWRGFLVPELSKWMKFTGVALVSGLLWAVWHWPMIYMGIYGNEGTPLYFQLLAFTLFITANGVILAYLRLKSSSVWTAVIFHMSSNVFLQEFFTPMTAESERSAWYVGEFGAIPAIVAAYFWWRGARESFASESAGASNPANCRETPGQTRLQ
jgi:membrane protease YdiL (CAAX protease family)